MKENASNSWAGIFQKVIFLSFSHPPTLIFIPTFPSTLYTPPDPSPTDPSLPFTANVPHIKFRFKFFREERYDAVDQNLWIKENCFLGVSWTAWNGSLSSTRGLFTILELQFCTCKVQQCDRGEKWCRQVPHEQSNQTWSLSCPLLVAEQTFLLLIIRVIF